MRVIANRVRLAVFEKSSATEVVKAAEEWLKSQDHSVEVDLADIKPIFLLNRDYVIIIPCIVNPPGRVDPSREGFA